MTPPVDSPQAHGERIAVIETDHKHLIEVLGEIKGELHRLDVSVRSSTLSVTQAGNATSERVSELAHQLDLQANRIGTLEIAIKALTDVSRVNTSFRTTVVAFATAGVTLMTVFTGMVLFAERVGTFFAWVAR
ncbi:MAG: hypothetical protein HC945_01870 [Nitrosarchaeum sp.]|nr:hypothetical protein [Nitrosarchaeum sp.]